MSSHLLVCFVAAAAHADDLERRLRLAAANLPAVPGCRGATLYRDRSATDRFVLLEEWDDETAHAVHLNAYVQGREWQAITDSLAEQPQGRWLHEVGPAADC